MSGRTRVKIKDLLSLLNLWVVGGAFSLACVSLFIVMTSLWLTRSTGLVPSQVTAVFTVVSAPIETQPQLTPISSSILTSTLQLPPSPPPGEIVLGAYVQVTGTGGDGLRLRDQPGLGSRVLLLGSEAEVFRVDAGPQEIDGYSWWYLVGPFDENRQGWAVSNFLKVVQNP